METAINLLAIWGALTIWPIVVLVIFVLTALVEEYVDDVATCGAAPIILFLAFLWLSGGIHHLDVFSFKNIVVGALVYLVAGVLYSAIRWHFYVSSVIDSFKTGRAYEHVKDDFERKTELNYSNKSRIMNWIALWPTSLLFTLIRELGFNLFGNLFKLVKGLFSYISAMNSAKLHRFSTIKNTYASLEKERQSE